MNSTEGRGGEADRAAERAYKRREGGAADRAIRDATEDVEARMRAAEACMDLADPDGPGTETTRHAPQTKSALAQSLRLLGARQHLDR